MKIYFGASLLYREERKTVYETVINTLKKAGHNLIGFDILSDTPQEVIASDNTRVDSYRKFLRWLSSCDQAVIEASFPSTLHIGHEISIALEKGKPVIVLYQKGKQPFFLAGIQSDKFTLIEYTTVDDIPPKLLSAIEKNEEIADTRFNFYISPEIGKYLDWVAKTKKLPRAVFLRDLLERQMRADKTFKP